jgi:hypothetical protein
MSRARLLIASLTVSPRSEYGLPWQIRSRFNLFFRKSSFLHPFSFRLRRRWNKVRTVSEFLPATQNSSREDDECHGNSQSFDHDLPQNAPRFLFWKIVQYCAVVPASVSEGLMLEYPTNFSLPKRAA